MLAYVTGVYYYDRNDIKIAVAKLSARHTVARHFASIRRLFWFEVYGFDLVRLIAAAFKEPSSGWILQSMVVHSTHDVLRYFYVWIFWA